MNILKVGKLYKCVIFIISYDKKKLRKNIYKQLFYVQKGEIILVMEAITENRPNLQTEFTFLTTEGKIGTSSVGGHHIKSYLEEL